jgi:hypothetical protein
VARIQILQDDLLLALEQSSYELTWVLDLTTGEVHFVPDDVWSQHDADAADKLFELMETDPGRFLHFRPLPSHVGFTIMEDFAEDLRDSRLKDDLFRALNSRHPFRHFKDALCASERVRNAFFAFHEQQMLDYAQQWLEDEQIDAELIPAVKVKQSR